MPNTLIHLTESWFKVLHDEFEKEYFHKLMAFLKQESTSGKVIYPSSGNIFRALDLTPLKDVKVVVLGQDPYHGYGQAHGLSFSVPNGVSAPPSLRNIFKELKSDLGIDRISTDLSDWAKQGVLLLNSILTVEENHPASHQKVGWENFTRRIISECNSKHEGVVFILWGAFAQSYIPMLDTKRHLVISSAHPSPFSAHKGFWGSKPFSKTNNFLLNSDRTLIEWA